MRAPPPGNTDDEDDAEDEPAPSDDDDGFDEGMRPTNDDDGGTECERDESVRGSEERKAASYGEEPCVDAEGDEPTADASPEMSADVPACWGAGEISSARKRERADDDAAGRACKLLATAAPAITCADGATQGAELPAAISTAPRV